MANHPFYNRWVGTFSRPWGESGGSAICNAHCNKAALYAGAGTRFGIGSGGEDVIGMWW